MNCKCLCVPLAVVEVLVAADNTAMVVVAAGQTSFGLKFAPAWVHGPSHLSASSPPIPCPSLFCLSLIHCITRVSASSWCSKNLSVTPLSAFSKTLRRGCLVLEAGWEVAGIVCPDEVGVASSLWSTTGNFFDIRCVCTHIYASVKGLGCGWLGKWLSKRSGLACSPVTLSSWDGGSGAEEDMEGGVECVVSITFQGLVDDFCMALLTSLLTASGSSTSLLMGKDCFWKYLKYLSNVAILLNRY